MSLFIKIARKAPSFMKGMGIVRYESSSFMERRISIFLRQVWPGALLCSIARKSALKRDEVQELQSQFLLSALHWSKLGSEPSLVTIQISAWFGLLQTCSRRNLGCSADFLHTEPNRLIIQAEVAWWNLWNTRDSTRSLSSAVSASANFIANNITFLVTH